MSVGTTPVCRRTLPFLRILVGASLLGTVHADSQKLGNPDCISGQSRLITEIDERFLGRYFQNGRWKTTIVLEPEGKGYFSSRMRKQIRNITRGWIYRYNEHRLPLTWGVLSGNGRPCFSPTTIQRLGGDEVVEAMTIELRYADRVEQRPLYQDRGTPRLGRARHLTD
jgi:hypothetical protein